MSINTERVLKINIPVLDILIPPGIFMGVLIVYLKTLTPSLSSLSPDGSELATIPAILGLAHSPGYPLYTWIGYLFSQIPIQDVAYRMNLLSAVSSALAMALLYSLLLQLFPSSEKEKPYSAVLYRSAVILGILVLAFSRDLWSQTVITEVYALNLLMIVLCLLALLRWEYNHKNIHFFLFALLFGLSMGTHLSNLGFAPSTVVFVLLSQWQVIRDWKWWLSALSGFVLGILQFLWLPLNASGLNDRLMQRSSPTTLQGIYNYTLDSFSNLKFAFPLQMLPERLVLYLYLLVEQFGWLGVMLGMIGMVVMLFWKPRAFYLFTGMYIVHIWFFIQYQAFDLEVFFIPSHMLWAIFMIFGIFATLRGILYLIDTLTHRENDTKQRSPFKTVILSSLLAAMIIVPVYMQLSTNILINDHSQDTAINDFYANVWHDLPTNSTLLTQSGVFGYSVFYWKLIYGIRPDVDVPALTNPNQQLNMNTTAALYSVVQPNTIQTGGKLPNTALAIEDWYIPLLYGESDQSASARNQWILYKVQNQPPDWSSSRDPTYSLDIALDGLKLVGYDLAENTVESGGELSLTLYWQIADGNIISDLTESYWIGEKFHHEHTILGGLLNKYIRAQSLQTSEIIVEQVNLVIPSTLLDGNYPLIIVLNQNNVSIEITLNDIAVQDEIGMVDGWLE